MYYANAQRRLGARAASWRRHAWGRLARRRACGASHHLRDQGVAVSQQPGDTRFQMMALDIKPDAQAARKTAVNRRHLWFS